MSENKVLRGKPVADALTEKIIEEVKMLRRNGAVPLLAMLKVGNREDDEAYQRGALSRCAKCNIDTKVVELDENCTQEEYIEALRNLNEDDKVHGILCFRPLPKQIDETLIETVIDSRKDVDCFSPANMAKIMSGDETGFPPCTPMGVMEIIRHYDIDIVGKKVAVLGRSLVVGKPLSILLLNSDATIAVCHSKTEDIRSITRESDVVISCMGRAKMVDSSYISEGAVVIDVGINFDEDGNMCGDVDFDSVLDKVSMITPVPRGVGSVTTSILAGHVVKACRQLTGI